MQDNVPEIVCCCDSGFVLPLVTMLTSLSKNLEIPLVRVNVITYNVTCEQLVHIKKIISFENIELIFYNGNTLIPDIVPTCEQYPKSIYLKIYGLNLLDPKIEKVIYLDTDLIVLSSIDKLYDMDLEGKMLLAVPEMDETIQLAKSKSSIQNYSELSIPANHKMLNSGVLLINLSKWRKNNICYKIEQYLKFNSKSIKLFDQELINTVLWDDWESLPLKWNITTDYYCRNGWLSNEISDKEYNEIRRNACILHFTKVPKPWIKGCKHPDKYVWENYHSIVMDNAPIGFIPYYHNAPPICPGDSGYYV